MAEMGDHNLRLYTFAAIDVTFFEFRGMLVKSLIFQIGQYQISHW